MGMEYYQEITLRPSGEVPLSFLWTKVYTQLHLAFVGHKDSKGNSPFAVSFPDYDVKGGLGNKVRIFAETKEALERLDVGKALARLQDYVLQTSIRKVPSQCITGYAVYSREHTAHSREQKARRYARRHNIPLEEALSLFPDRETDLKLPYIQMQSLTNRRKFSLFIQKRPAAAPMAENISLYGLSFQATVPEF